MKTPRELLFKRHEAASEKLDALRKNVLAREWGNAKADARPWPVRIPLKLWFELIRPAPRIWAGFAAVWIAIIVLHLADSNFSTPATAQSLARSSEIVLPWK